MNNQNQNDMQDMIIKDKDGVYKIWRDGKFIPLDQATEEKVEDVKPTGPKRGPQDASKPIPQISDKPKPEIKKEVVSKPKNLESFREQVTGLHSPALLKAAEEMIAKSGVTFASKEIRSRAVNTLVTHKKGVRKPQETIAQLTKPADKGGVGLTKDEAEKLIGRKEEVKRPEINIQATKAPQSIVKTPANLPVGKEIAPPPKIEVKEPPLAAFKKSIQPSMPKVQTPVKPVVTPRPVISDVQKPNKPVVGMIDELSYSLADFRRLGQDPMDRIKKIETQLDVLEQDGFERRLRGLQAWRQSEVMTKYLQVGKHCVEKNIPVDQVLVNPKPTDLTIDEWHAIAELNKRIRF